VSIELAKGGKLVVVVEEKEVVKAFKTLEPSLPKMPLRSKLSIRSSVSSNR
jgi:hypothetical protein